MQGYRVDHIAIQVLEKETKKTFFYDEMHSEYDGEPKALVEYNYDAPCDYLLTDKTDLYITAYRNEGWFPWDKKTEKGWEVEAVSP